MGCVRPSCVADGLDGRRTKLESIGWSRNGFRVAWELCGLANKRKGHYARWPLLVVKFADTSRRPNTRSGLVVTHVALFAGTFSGRRRNTHWCPVVARFAPTIVVLNNPRILLSDAKMGIPTIHGLEPHPAAVYHVRCTQGLSI